MQARNTRNHAAKPTRAERRAAERDAQKERRHSPRREVRISPLLLFGTVALLIVAMGAFAFLTVRPFTSTSSVPSEVALTTSRALNPVPDHLKVGTMAPNFMLMDRYNESYTLSAERGHPVFVEFFATWCAVCHRETTVMNQITQKYWPKGLNVWAVLANPYGPNYEASQGKDITLAVRSDLNWYQQTYKAHYPLLIDPKFGTVNRYGVGGYPTLYLIDTKGRVSYVNSGAVPFKQLSKQIDQVLKGASKEPQSGNT